MRCIGKVVEAVLLMEECVQSYCTFSRGFLYSYPQVPGIFKLAGNHDNKRHHPFNDPI